MAIFGIREEIQATIEEKNDESLIPIFESEKSNETIQVTLPGYKWKVTYFHRSITDNTFITQYDPNLDITLTDYNRIDDFIIHVENPLPTGISDDLTGSGLIDIDIIPTPNDLFLTKIADGRTFIFVITAVNRLTYNNDNVFKIEYKAYAEISDKNDPIFVNLLNGVTTEHVYNEKYRLDHTQPLYTKQAAATKEDYFRNIERLSTFWIDKFISPTTNFYIAYVDPETNEKIFDPQMEDFVRDIIGINNLPNKLETANIEDRKISILDYIIKEEIEPKRINAYRYLGDKGIDSNNPYLFSHLYSGLDKIVTVTDRPLFDKTDVLLNTYFPKIETETYIFRKYIYDTIFGNTLNINFTTLSKFEQLFLSMINGDVLNKKIIDEIYPELYNLPDIEQFYFMPIFLYIMKYYLTTFSVEYI